VASPGDRLAAALHINGTSKGFELLPVQCRMARAAIGLSVKKLAAAAKVSPETVVRFEAGERIRQRTIGSLRQVLEAAGLEFTDGRKPGVRIGSRLA
jgi:transcriptional regulator with XRE-family HTH domain